MDRTSAVSINAELDDAVARIGDRFRGHDQSLRDRLVKPLHDAYQRGRHDAVQGLRTTAQTADELGRSRRYIQQLVRNHGMGWTVGRDIILSAEEVDRLRDYVRVDHRRRRG